MGFAVYEDNWSANTCVCGCGTIVVASDPIFEVMGMAYVIGAVGATEDVYMIHKHKPLDALRLLGTLDFALAA